MPRKGSDGEQKYSSLCLTLALDGGGWLLYPWERDPLPTVEEIE